MHPADVGKLSELAKSLYQHRLAGSMDDAFEMAKKMMLTDHPGEQMSAKAPASESSESALAENTLQGSADPGLSFEAAVPVLESSDGHDQEALDPPATLTELKADMHEAQGNQETTEKTMERLGNEIKSLKEQLAESTKEFDEIKEYLKDIEDLAKQGKEAKKKEETGVKIAEIADKPVTEFDDKLELSGQ